MRRRRLLQGAALAVAAGALTAGAALVDKPRRDEVGPYSLGVALGLDGTPVLIDVDSSAAYLPGSRVVAPQNGSAAAWATAAALAEGQRDWLAAGIVPGAGTDHEELVRSALLDLSVLTLPHGGTVAALNHKWHYVWPRDAAFVAAAFAATGHHADAASNLHFLQRVQHDDGSFQARYLPDGAGTPDDRGRQTDGTGWAVWALERVVAAAPAAEQSSIAETFGSLLRRSTAFLLAEVGGGDALPAPSSDYWEHRERALTLGTAAPVLAGLEAAGRLHERLGDESVALQVRDSAARTRAAIEHRFGRHGYGRYAHRGADADAASAFVLPPYQPSALTGAVTAWRDSVEQMRRPAGGLAPGGGWQETGLSWTPETALYAWAAAAVGDVRTAHDWLRWLAAHRTTLGAIPEKVRDDGGPAGPAPLAWSCALVVLTAVELGE